MYNEGLESFFTLLLPEQIERYVWVRSGFNNDENIIVSSWRLPVWMQDWLSCSGERVTNQRGGSDKGLGQLLESKCWMLVEILRWVSWRFHGRTSNKYVVRLASLQFGAEKRWRKLGGLCLVSRTKQVWKRIKMRVWVTSSATCVWCNKHWCRYGL